MTCPACEKRVQQEQRDASNCKQEVKQLEAKSVRLTIVLTALSTLVGKELLDEALTFADSIPFLGASSPIREAVVVQAPAEDGGDSDTHSRPKERFVTRHSDLSITANPSFLAEVPPLTASLYAPAYEAQQLFGLSFGDGAIVPDSGYPLFMLAGIKGMRGRKR